MNQGATIPSRAPFVGRAAELTALVETLDQAAAGSTRVVLIAGDAGIGKTRLTEVAAAGASGRGFIAAWGRCWEGDPETPEQAGAPAFWPWVQILRTVVQVARPEVLDRVAGPLAVVEAALPDVRRTAAVASAAADADALSARFRLFDAVTTLLTTVAGAQPLLVIIDDLHWADPSSLLLLEFVGREAPDAPLALIVTYRDVGLSVDRSLTRTIGALARRPSTLQIGLVGLGAEDVTTFIRRAMPGLARPERLASRLVQQTDGNPLFVTELLRTIAADGSVGAGASGEFAVPPTVKDVINRRVQTLSPTCRRFLCVAAVAGRTFELPVIEGTGEIGEAVLLGAVAEAISQHLIAPVPGQPAWLRFTHALVREALYDDLTVARRIALHRQLGEALERVAGADPERLAEIAAHYYAAARSDGGERAVRSLEAAATAARARLAFEDEAHLYRMALDALDFAPAADPHRRCDLLLLHGEAQNRAGELEAAKETLLRAAALARGLGDPASLARAALAFGGYTVSFTGADPRRGAMLSEALSLLPEGDSSLRSRLLANLTVVAYWTDGPAEAERLSAAALAMARRLNDEVALGWSLRARHAAIWQPGRYREGLELAREMLAVGEAIGDPDLLTLGSHWRALDLFESGDGPAAAAAARMFIDRARGTHQAHHLMHARLCEGMLAQMRGDLVTAEHLMATAPAVDEQTHGPYASVYRAMQLFGLRWAQGRLTELVPAIEAFARQYPDIAAGRAALALAACESGRTDDARRLVDDLWALDLNALPRDSGWLPLAVLLAAAVAQLGVRAHAPVLYDLLAPYREQHAILGVTVLYLGAVEFYLGLLAGVAGRLADAEAHLAAAHAAHAHMGASQWTLRSEAALADLRACSDPAAGATTWEEAAAAARRMGVVLVHWAFAADVGPSRTVDTVAVTKPDRTPPADPAAWPPATALIASRPGAVAPVMPAAAGSASAGEDVDPDALCSYLVRAAPFERFSDVNDALTAIRTMPGVQAANLRRLQGGVLLIEVIVRGEPLAQRLDSLRPRLPAVTWQIESVSTV
jgi:tetratricopeptide (TPR) repeat protein